MRRIASILPLVAPVMLLLALIPAAPAAAGPWVRAPGGVFLSGSAEAVRDGGRYVSLYGEYGWRDRLMLGFALGHGAQTETSALVWMQRALDDGSGPDRWALGLGVGAVRRDGGTQPQMQLMASWGRGLDKVPLLDLVPGGGWLAVDARLQVMAKFADEADIIAAHATGDLDYWTPEAATKLDITLGLHPFDSVMLINQLRLEKSKDAGFSGKLAVSVVRDMPGPFKLELGLIEPLSGQGDRALKLGAWVEF